MAGRDLQDEGSKDIVWGRLLGLFNNETSDCPFQLERKSAEVSGEICIGFSQLWIASFKSSEEYGPNHCYSCAERQGLASLQDPQQDVRSLRSAQ